MLILNEEQREKHGFLLLNKRDICSYCLDTLNYPIIIKGAHTHTYHALRALKIAKQISNDVQSLMYDLIVENNTRTGKRE